MNKKLVRNIIISAVVISVLAVVYFFVINWEPEEEQTAPVQVAETITVYEKDVQSIQKIEFNNPNGNYSIVKNGDEYSVPEYPGARLLQSRLGDSFSIIKKFVAKRIITESGNLMDYGLDNPTTKVSVYDSAGATDTILIGNLDPTNTGYYVKTADSDVIYFVNAGTVSVLLEGVDYYRDTNISSFDITGMKTFELYKGGQLIASIRQKQESDTLQELVVDDLVMTYPYYEYVMSEELMAPYTDLTSIKAISIVADTTKNSSKYDIGRYTLKVVEDEKTHVLKLGKQDSQGNVYAVYEGIDAVYTIDSAWLKAVEAFDPFNCLFKLVHVFNMDDVNTVEFTTDAGSHKLEIDRGIGTEVLKINDKTVDEEVFKKAYLKIVEIRATSSADKNIKQGREVAKISFTLAKGGSSSVRYCEYDDRNYVVIKPDGSKLLVLKKNFDAVFGEISDIIK